MIIRLEPRDSAILARLAQYLAQDFRRERLEDLLHAASPIGQEIGQVLLGKDPEEIGQEVVLLLGRDAEEARQNVAETAMFIRDWAQKNHAYATQRVAAAG